MLQHHTNIHQGCYQGWNSDCSLTEKPNSSNSKPSQQKVRTPFRGFHRFFTFTFFLLLTIPELLIISQFWYDLHLIQSFLVSVLLLIHIYIPILIIIGFVIQVLSLPKPVSVPCFMVFSSFLLQAPYFHHSCTASFSLWF